MADTDPNLPELFTTDEAEVDGHVGADAGTHNSPSALGLEPFQWVAVAMLVFFAILVWKKVPALVAGMLDKSIAAIRENLDDAKKLRAEAEALRDEYTAKIAGAEKDAAAMIDNAKREAEAIVTRAEADTAAVIKRREAMAEDKIAAAERAAVDDLRARAANAATAAARGLIAQNHTLDADRTLVNETISNL